MATQYIKNVKKHENFFLQIMGSGGGMALFGQGMATTMSKTRVIFQFFVQ